MKNYLNAQVKHRETFRPFAPSVLEEHAGSWFDLTGRSSYMLRVVTVKTDRRALIPAIVHVDGTARVQTVNKKENPEYWNLIWEFQKLTAIPLVLNTSFNVASKPIVERPSDAVQTFLSTNIDLLALGPYLLSKMPLQNLLDNERKESAASATPS
jgi:carbamoyltransferase